MADLIQSNREDNPRLNQIYQTLLLAGYFRIRIGSLKAFDKVIGGIAWCITSSNFQIEIQYSDEMQLGQKIKVAEAVCNALQRMKCPYILQPHQLQGLDINNIFPVVQWLVKFVYETRFQRQKYDRQLSLILGKPITKLQQQGNPGRVAPSKIQRNRINRAMQKIGYRNPIRAYSALLQFNDASATQMYNRLLNIMSNKSKVNQKSDQSKGKLNNESYKDLIQNQNQEENVKEERQMNQFGIHSGHKISLDKLEKIILENKESIQEGIQEHQIQEEFIHQLSKPGSMQTGDKQKEPAEFGTSEQQRQLKQLKAENKKYQQKIQILRNQLLSFEAISSQLDHQIEQIRIKNEEAKSIAQGEIEKNQQYREAEKQINEQLKASKTKVNSKLQKLVEKRQALKNKKTQLKKKAKGRIDELSYELQVAQASVPEIDQQAFKEMMKQAEMKKQIYDKKYEELTLVNQQLAILQRKAQNYTSPPEIAQYHQRFVELFESINVLIEQKRSMFSQIANLEALKKVVSNYIQIMSNMKNGYIEVKKKAQLKQFNEDIKDIVNGLEANMKNSETTLAKMKGKRQSVYGEYMDLIKLQRDYLHLLRMLKIQYQNAAKMYK